MATKYCSGCGRSVTAKRHMGIGTLILVICTLGWGLLALPFYKKKCPICKGTSLSNYLKGQSDPWDGIGGVKSKDPWSDIGNDKSEDKKCPFCAELIKAEAIVCRYCKSELQDSN